VCFLTLVFVFGSGYNTASVFFTPVLKSFGWSRARTSSLQTVLALAAGLTAPLAGWLLDRIQVRFVMAVSAVSTLAGFVLASQAHSYATMVAAYLFIGLGLGGGTLLPCAMVVANWFQARRGIAMGVTMSGTALGGTLMAPISNHVIQTAGWRAGYLVMGVPLVVLIIPLILLMLRTRPDEDRGRPVAESARGLPGLEVGEAIRTGSIWFIAATQFCFAFAVAGVNLHSVPCLIGFGYTPAQAAWDIGLVWAFGAVGKWIMGLASDRAGGRPAVCLGLILMAVGAAALLGARRTPLLATFVFVYGFASGTPLVLLPIVLAESMGLKRFGSLAGFLGIFHTTGAALGPLVVGRMFDLQGNYVMAISLCVAVLVVGAASILGARPLAQDAPPLGVLQARA
jgi:MFS family permease